MRYVIENHSSYRIDDEDQRELMSNFDARITDEIHFVDGLKRESQLTIAGTKPSTDPTATEPIKLPAITIPAAEFPGLNWVLPNWGVQAVIRPGSSIKDDLRTSIQLNSTPLLRTVYKHTGWTEIEGNKAYLHAGGAIYEDGNDESVTVQLPPELSKYDLSCESPPIECIRATLDIIKLTLPEIAWPLLAATVAPMFGEVDFGLHITGRTGTFKSEVTSLFQSHYGCLMDARHLPGSWSSTGNALEAQAFLAKNAVFVVDDFVPIGTSWQQRAYQTTADKLIRSQGNQAGRARLTDTSNLQQTMFPRGLVLSTGEDTPEGHSVRARLLIIELSPGTIDTKDLTKAQKNREKYPGTLRALAMHLAGTDAAAALTSRSEEIRRSYLEIGHTRTPAMLARLTACIEYFIEWAVLEKAITHKKATELTKEATESIKQAGMKQAVYLEATDPCDLFAASVRNVFGAGLGHVRTVNGGIPMKAEILGWVTENSHSDMPTWKSRGPCIGWVDWQQDELLIDVTAGYNIVRKSAGNEVSLTKQTMLRRLKDSGRLARTDDARQRNTVRVMSEGHPRQVIAMILSTTLETQEKPNEYDERDTGE